MVITYAVQYMSKSCGLVTLEVRTKEGRKPWVHVHVEDISQVGDGIADWYGSWDRLPTWCYPVGWDYRPLSDNIIADLQEMCYRAKTDHCGRAYPRAIAHALGVEVQYVREK